MSNWFSKGWQFEPQLMRILCCLLFLRRLIALLVAGLIAAARKSLASLGHLGKAAVRARPPPDAACAAQQRPVTSPRASSQRCRTCLAHCTHILHASHAWAGLGGSSGVHWGVIILHCAGGAGLGGATGELHQLEERGAAVEALVQPQRDEPTEQQRGAAPDAPRRRLAGRARGVPAHGH